MKPKGDVREARLAAGDLLRGRWLAGGVPFVAFWVGLWIGLWGLVCAGATSTSTQRVTLMTFNVENYLLEPVGSRKAKPEASRARVASILKSVGADVVALQEIGGEAALNELCGRVAALGFSYPHRERVQGFDTNIQVCLISRYPIVRRRPHVDDAYLLSGRRFRVSRGILEADIEVAKGVVVTVFGAHLKSRRASPEADEAEMRLEEARILRAKVDTRLRSDPRAKVVVLGDLNDTKDSRAIRLLIGRGKDALVDTRPGERNAEAGVDGVAGKGRPVRTVTWTHHYALEDTYSRVDYVLLHGTVARGWRSDLSYVPSFQSWGEASDHRPVVVVLELRGG